MKRILLIAPPLMDLYKDVANELIRQSYDVDTITLTVSSKDPYFVHVKNSK